MRIRPAVLLLGLLILAGCTSTSEGSPRPAPTADATAEPTSTSDGSDSDLPSDGAPSVANPLDVTAFEENLCSLLTTQQAQELNVPQVSDDADGEFCHWGQGELGGGSAQVDFLGNGRGLSAKYRIRNDYAYFDETMVEGYPAIAYDLDDLRNVTGRCFVTVGVSDDNVLTVLLNLSKANVGKKDPCKLAADVAGMMINNIKADQ